MAMQTNLSRKDKITIAILLFAGAMFMLIWFLIRPTITSIITINEKIEQAEETQNQYKNKIIYLTSAEAIYGKAVNDLTDSTAEYYEIMDSSEIDRMVTSYVLKSGLFAEELTIRMPVTSVVESPYVYSSLYSDSSGKTVTSSGSSSNKSNDSDKDTSADNLLAPYTTARSNSNSTFFSGVQCAELQIVVTGKPEVCQAFIDDICTKPSVRVTGFEWAKVSLIEVYNAETDTYDKVDPGTMRLTITLNLYMADIADYNVVVSE